MTAHFGFLCLFSIAVGIVLGAMLRRRPRDAVVLATWIALGLIGGALMISWAMLLLPI